MDAALKQRLVGASVIIALAVIFIPMIFDDSNRSQNQSISIKIPDEPTDLKHKTINIDSQSQSSNDEIKTEPKNEIEVIEKTTPIKKQESIIDVVDNSKITKQPKQDPKTEIQKQTKPVIVAIKKDIRKELDNTDVDLKTDASEDKSIDNPLKASYRVKLGSFSSQKNAQQLKAKIVNKGFKAYVEKDDATGLYKVFSNQVNSRKEADAMNVKIQKLKLNIGKTSVEKLAAEAQNKAELQLDSGWILQIGSFSSKENSLKLRDKIRKKGFVSFVDEIFNPKKQRRYRVRIGPYATREEAITEQNKIKKSMNLKSLIKPHEKQRVIN